MIQPIQIDYTNWSGKRAKRVVEPLAVLFKESIWHGEAQWIMVARDLERDVIREFAMKDVHSSAPVTFDEKGVMTIGSHVEGDETVSVCSAPLAPTAVGLASGPSVPITLPIDNYE